MPWLFQLKVDIAGAAAKHVYLVEEIMRTPFVHHRLEVALADRHLGIDRFAHLDQIVTHGLLACDEARVHDVSAIKFCYRVGEVHAQFVFGPLALSFLGLGCSTILKT